MCLQFGLLLDTVRPLPVNPDSMALGKWLLGAATARGPQPRRTLAHTWIQDQEMPHEMVPTLPFPAVQAADPAVEVADPAAVFADPAETQPSV